MLGINPRVRFESNTGTLTYCLTEGQEVCIIMGSVGLVVNEVGLVQRVVIRDLY